MPATATTPSNSPWLSEPVQVPTIEEVCDWLAAHPPLDDIATETRRLRLVLKDATEALTLLRQHVLLAIGEPPAQTPRTIVFPGAYDDDVEPF